MCKEKETRPVAATGHAYGEWIITKAPTCKKEGKAKQTCSKCNKSVTKTLPVTDHNWVLNHQIKAATCTEAGEITNQCKDCKISSGSTIVPALGHDWSEYTAYRNPTCKTEGAERRHCRRCNRVEDRPIPKVAHDWSDWTISGSASCTEEKTAARTCSKCKKKETKKIYPTLHNWDDWVETKRATCTSDGQENRLCRDCKQMEKRTIPSTGHNWGSWSTTRKATCTSSGQQKRTCSICKKYETKTIAAYGHNYSMNNDSTKHWQQCNNCGSKKSQQNHKYNDKNYCDVCGYATTDLTNERIAPVIEVEIENKDKINLVFKDEGGSKLKKQEYELLYTWTDSEEVPEKDEDYEYKEKIGMPADNEKKVELEKFEGGGIYYLHIKLDKKVVDNAGNECEDKELLEVLTRATSGEIQIITER